jgi:hypothetical protein
VRALAADKTVAFEARPRVAGNPTSWFRPRTMGGRRTSRPGHALNIYISVAFVHDIDKYV